MGPSGKNVTALLLLCLGAAVAGSIALQKPAAATAPAIGARADASPASDPATQAALRRWIS